jgi:hypothetical protein
VWATTFREVPILHDILQTTGSLGQHAFVIDLHRHDVHSARPDCLDSVHVGVFLAQKTRTLVDWVAVGVPFFAESLNGLGEAVCGAAGEDDLGAVLVWHEGVQVLACELADEIVERRVALRLAVL